jgi:hypothetical protein
MSKFAYQAAAAAMAVLTVLGVSNSAIADKAGGHAVSVPVMKMPSSPGGGGGPKVYLNNGGGVRTHVVQPHVSPAIRHHVPPSIQTNTNIKPRLDAPLVRHNVQSPVPGNYGAKLHFGQHSKPHDGQWTQNHIRHHRHHRHRYVDFDVPIRVYGSYDDCGYLWRRYQETRDPYWKFRYDRCID